MILIEGKKYACQACIRGHRASSCNHTSRELTEIRPKGRPISQCERCRLMRKTHKAHVKCECVDKDDKPVVPKRKSRKLHIEDLPRSRISSIENLLNPCACTQEKFCACCRPKFSEFLHNKYPPDIVEDTAKSFSANLIAPQSIRQLNSEGNDDGLPPCPSGPDAPCCKVRPLAAHREREKQLASAMETLKRDSALGSSPRTNSTASLPSPTSVDMQNGHKLPSRPHAPAHATIDGSAQHMLETSVGPTMPTHSGEKPDCKCGCDCSKKLELLIQAIEARIGQPLSSVSELNIHSDEDPSEWVENVLAPLSPSVRQTATTTSLLASASPSSSSLSPSSAAGVTEPEETGFSAGVIPPFPVTAASGSCCSTTVEAPTAAPAPPKASCCSSNKPADSPPTQQPAVAASCCSSTSQPVLPQQATIVEPDSCCGPAPTTKSSNQPPSSCCSGSGGSAGEKCSCCSQKRKRGWQPGDAQNPMIDEDGALACSCGCYKPFEECTDCFEDLCESVLLKPN